MSSKPLGRGNNDGLLWMRLDHLEMDPVDVIARNAIRIARRFKVGVELHCGSGRVVCIFPDDSLSFVMDMIREGEPTS
jgi:hypothetical protein